MDNPADILAAELRYLLHHVIPSNVRNGSRTGGHLYWEWLMQGYSSPQSIRIDHHLYMMHELGYDDMIKQELHRWNRKYAPITRMDKRNQPHRLVLQLHYHTERQYDPSQKTTTSYDEYQSDGD